MEKGFIIYMSYVKHTNPNLSTFEPSCLNVEKLNPAHTGVVAGAIIGP
jgi:hypothetical protein